MKDTKLIHHSGHSWQTIAKALDKCRAMEKNPKNWTDVRKFKVMLNYMKRTLKLAQEMHVDDLDDALALHRTYRNANEIRDAHLAKEAHRDF